ncbi:aromatic amino acid aminotransferase [Bombella intestini]|uniref:Aminotransferase n=1 Tax=Bombella intestini TaxID=1539051 RepID=A0A1S8GNG0_9PROT|nr:amino acid aminotransferase [Bombella intestini]OOL17335.1 aromatic amino acid aminotransferase [Bombella intestini]
MFQSVELSPGDPILSLVEDFKRDDRAQKVNLSIGLYYDEAGHVPQLACIRRAYERLASQQDRPDLYLPMEGLASYRLAVQHLLFGRGSEPVQAGRIATVQTLGGSGALKVGADFLHRYFPQAELWVSNPTWENHISIFEGAGFKTRTYPYFDPATGGVDFEAMLACIRQIPAGHVVLLHPCCHNPTGADLTDEQWDMLVPVLKERKLIPFLDLAYQGLGRSLEEDVYAVRVMVAAGLEFLLSNSFSKVFSLYGDRIGALSVVCPDEGTAERVLSQLKVTVRRNYSSPPVRGAQLVDIVLGDQALSGLWQDEVAAMGARIREMRKKLHEQLVARLPGQDFRYLLEQRGMFSMMKLSPAQVDRLREEHGVYVLRSGRVCMAGLNERNLPPVVEALAAVLASA